MLASQCCRSLYGSLYGERLIWLLALKGVLDKACLAPFSCLPDQLTLQELRRLVCRPSRTEALLVNSRHLELVATEIYPVYELLGESNEVTPSRFDVVLLPGSRWMLDFAEDINSTLVILCWDIRLRNDDETCSPVAQHFVKAHSVMSWTQQLSSDRESIILLINGTDEYDNW